MINNGTARPYVVWVLGLAGAIALIWGGAYVYDSAQDEAAAVQREKIAMDEKRQAIAEKQQALDREQLAIDRERRALDREKAEHAIAAEWELAAQIGPYATVICKGEPLVVTSVSYQARAILGWDPKALIGHPISDIMLPQYKGPHDLGTKHRIDYLREHGNPSPDDPPLPGVVGGWYTQDGEERTGVVRTSTILLPSGTPMCVSCIVLPEVIDPVGETTTETALGLR